MTNLTDVLEKEQQAAEKGHICLKELNNPETREVKDCCPYTNFSQVAAHEDWNVKYQI